MLTRVFKSGNSLAIRIPKELAIVAAALDRLIAAHAVSVGAILVTNNEVDFKGYPGLVVENWIDSH